MDVDCNKNFVGGIPGYFDPFVDNEIDLNADAIPASKVLSNETVPLSLSCKSSCAPDRITYSPSKSAFMTDEGPAFPSVAERFGWSHLLDRRLFARGSGTKNVIFSNRPDFISECSNLL